MAELVGGGPHVGPEGRAPQQQCLAAIAERPLESVGEPAVGQLGEPLLRERRAGAVAAEVREPFTVVRVQVHRRVQ